MSNFKTILDNSKSALIILPKTPFFDQAAAGLALYLALRDKLNVSIYSPNPMTVEFNRLIGVNKIKEELGNKNLTIKFSGYKADGIEKVSYDIEGSEFKLTVIPKPGIVAPNEEQIQIGHSGVAADTAILIGGANDSHFPDIATKEFEGIKLAHIGMFPINLNEKSAENLTQTASSVSEVVARLVKEAELSYDRDIATNLLMGMYEGSKNFASNYVTEETFAIASELMAAGGSHIARDKVDAKDFPQGITPPVTTDTQNQEPVKTEETPSQAPAETEDAPKAWLEPKIYKGNSS